MSEGVIMSQKIFVDPETALAGLLFDGMTIMSGGFGLTGNPENLIPAIKASGVKELTIISNNCQFRKPNRSFINPLIKNIPRNNNKSSL